MHEITPNKAWQLLSEDDHSVLIDVRQLDEWNSGHVDLSSTSKEATLLSISSNMEDFIEKLNQQIPQFSTDIMFICRSGARSAVAAKAAEMSGYRNTYNVTGGFNRWVKDGLKYRGNS